MNADGSEEIENDFLEGNKNIKNNSVKNLLISVRRDDCRRDLIRIFYIDLGSKMKNSIFSTEV